MRILKAVEIQLQETLRKFVESSAFQVGVIVLVLVNAVILGAETLAPVKASYGTTLMIIDRMIIYAFVLEVFCRFAVQPSAYFRNGWNIFDFVVVAISLIATTSGLAAIRAFRVLRVLRVVTVIPRMRTVVAALFDAIPGIASVGIILVLIVYIFAVIAANMYGPAHPEIFGDVFVAMYTLFQIMTLEGWPDIANAVAQTHPRSWIFFLTFVLIATFTMLNLFVAIVVKVIEEDSDQEVRDEIGALRKEIGALRDDIAHLRISDGNMRD